MLRLLIISALLTVGVLFACGPTETPRKCTPESCKGCCTIEDRCEEGNLKAACGVGGVVCNVCKDVDYCRNGNCTDNPGCASLNQACTVPENCCVGMTCSGGVCTGGGGGCTPSGGACSDASDCCSNFCSSGGVCLNQCGALNGSCIPCCQPGLTCINQSCQPGSGGGSGSGGGGGSACAPLNASCSSVVQCCGAYFCQSGTCRP